MSLICKLGRPASVQLRNKGDIPRLRPLEYSLNNKFYRVHKLTNIYIVSLSHTGTSVEHQLCAIISNTMKYTCSYSN